MTQSLLAAGTQTLRAAVEQVRRRVPRLDARLLIQHLLGISHAQYLADPDRSQPYYGEAWGLTGRYGVDDPAARLAFWRRVRGRPGVAEVVGPAVEVRFHRAELDVSTGEVRRGALLQRLEP